MALGRSFPVGIKGMVMGTKPADKSQDKPKTIIQIAANKGGEAHVIEVRDFDIKNAYTFGDKFDQTVIFSEWQMGNRSGCNFTVDNDAADLVDFDVEVKTKPLTKAK